MLEGGDGCGVIDDRCLTFVRVFGGCSDIGVRWDQSWQMLVDPVQPPSACRSIKRCFHDRWRIEQQVVLCFLVIDEPSVAEGAPPYSLERSDQCSGRAVDLSPCLVSSSLELQFCSGKGTLQVAGRHPALP